MSCILYGDLHLPEAHHRAFNFCLPPWCFEWMINFTKTNFQRQHFCFFGRVTSCWTQKGIIQKSLSWMTPSMLPNPRFLTALLSELSLRIPSMVELGTNLNLGQQEEATSFHFFMIEKWRYHETLRGQTQGPGINMKFHLICWRVIQRGFPSKWWALHSFQMTHRIAINGAFHIILPPSRPNGHFPSLQQIKKSTRKHPPASERTSVLVSTKLGSPCTWSSNDLLIMCPPST